MPPAILADSDDDGDDLILEPDADQSLPAPNDYAVPAVDGSNEQSTGSTERLQNQIRSAERAFFTVSPKKAAMSVPVAHSSGSPTTQANKRRHTAVFGSEAAVNPEKRVKRTKTYSTKRSSALAANDEGRIASSRQDGQAPATSQSARFTEHSDANSSNRLPAGSIKAAFVGHEPNVMFRDTGSTAVDNESSQQRMIEQALGSRKGPSTSAAKLLESDEFKSSSFPWSASEQTQSTKKAAPTDDQPASADDVQMRPEVTQGNNDGILQPGSAPDDSVELHPEQQVNADQPNNDGERSWLEIMEVARKMPAGKEDVSPKLRSSPRVEIIASPTEAKSPPPPPPAAAPASVPKSTRGRKCKVQEEATDPINSDDIAVGLPMERYKPRPSRRRATQIDEEPIDFSVRPEKAAKLKRTKTTAVETYTDVDESITQRGKDSSQSDRAKGGVAGKTPDKNAQDVSSGAHDDYQPRPSDDQKLEAIAKLSKEDPKSMPVQPVDSIESPVKKQNDDEILVKPTPKPKSTAKAKRSHTTIFEDHVDFAGSQRTPSLTQQQAKRKSALKDVDNEATQARQRKRRKVIDDDDDDELAHEAPKDPVEDAESPAREAEHQPEEASKKRGRGRPAKAPTKAKVEAKSVDKVLGDSEAEPDEDEAEEDEAPKKKGRGRPAKAAATKKTAATQQPAKHTETVDGLTTQKQDSTETITNSKQAAMTPSKPSTPSMQEPTPSPENPPAGKSVATPQKKTSSTSHSPLKSSSKVPLRVGLSKRQRIAPLLRVMKAPKR